MSSNDIELDFKDVQQFIDLWEAHPVLWNPEVLAYRDRNARTQACLSISDTIGKGWTADQVKRKIYSLRAQYLRCKKRTEKNGSADESYETWAHYDRIRSFLSKISTDVTDDLPEGFPVPLKMAHRKPVELSKHETDVLLGLYSGCECLWNTKNADYKEDRIRVGALRTIINGMRLETGKDFSTAQMQTALDKIRDKYTQELQEVLNAEKSGNDYTSQWRWFRFLDSFLRDNILHAQKTKTDVESGKHDILNKEAIVDEDNDTDDYYCTALDSGDEDSRTSASKKPRMQVLPTQPQAPPASTSSRPVRASSRRFSAMALVNGTSHSAETPATDIRESGRKRRRGAGSSAASNARNSATSAAGASGGHVSNLNTSGSTSSSHVLRSAKTDRSSGQVSTNSDDSLRISAQIADTLKTMQVLLATSLSNQDQPAVVFARHIANELQQISDFTQRKQCMLDIQQVILRYQTKQQESVATGIKFEGRSNHSEEEEMTVTGDGMASGGSEGRVAATVTQPQCADESLLLYFDTP